MFDAVPTWGGATDESAACVKSSAASGWVIVMSVDVRARSGTCKRSAVNADSSSSACADSCGGSGRASDAGNGEAFAVVAVETVSEPRRLMAAGLLVLVARWARCCHCRGAVALAANSAASASAKGQVAGSRLRLIAPSSSARPRSVNAQTKGEPYPPLTRSVAWAG